MIPTQRSARTGSSGSSAAYYPERNSDGRFIGPFNPALQSPISCGGFLDVQACEEENSSLTPAPDESKVP
jgi:hypothetical protein